MKFTNIRTRGAPFTLLIAVDDATGTVVDALFCQPEDAHSYCLLIHGLIERLGLPVARYTDRHGVFRHTPGSGLPGMPPRFSRAMEELGVQMIFARSPQGKGRVARAAGTFQDRLVTELRRVQFGPESFRPALDPGPTAAILQRLRLATAQPSLGHGQTRANPTPN